MTHLSDKTESHDVAVVGGGLVGSLLATLLVDHGHAVTIFERGPDLRQGRGGGGRSINLVLTRRGIRALERVGLDKGALELTVAVTGRMVHALDGSKAFQPYGKDDSECNYSVSRSGLNAYLIRHAAERGVKLRCDAPLIDADLKTNRLTFAQQGGAPGDSASTAIQVDAGVVFGADGGGSRMREAFHRVEGFAESSEMLEHGYKELTIPATDDGGYRIESHALHIWPRRDLMLMALPNQDGSFTVTLFMPFAGDDGFDALKTEADVERLFKQYFPNALPLLPDLGRTFLENPTGKLGTVRCHPWNTGGGAVLVGDAAHAIVPFFGQGMNSGFEDCTLLDDLMRRYPRGDWPAVFADFSKLRKPDADAIADMALENFVEMRDSVADAEFLLGKQIDHRLEQEMPQLYRSRYSMVMYSHIPFSTAFAAGAIQREIRDELRQGIDRVEDLDLERARELIDRKLTPFLRKHGVQLDY